MKRLYRSSADRKISGVCGGIAEYFNLDPTVVRLAFALFSLVGGSGLIAYIICLLIIPEDPDAYQDIDVNNDPKGKS